MSVITSDKLVPYHLYWSLPSPVIMQSRITCSDETISYYRRTCNLSPVLKYLHSPANLSPVAPSLITRQHTINSPLSRHMALSTHRSFIDVIKSFPRDRNVDSFPGLYARRCFIVAHLKNHCLSCYHVVKRSIPSLMVYGAHITNNYL